VGFDRHFGGTRVALETDGVELNVLRAGPEDGPPIVFVHGYPDTHEVWLTTIARLVDDFRCVAYDVRGAGGSTAPDATEGYRVEHLVDDLVAVLDHVAPAGRRVHLVGHDWGSVQLWEAVLLAPRDERLRDRIGSFTTISGPSLGHFGAWSRRMQRGSWSDRLTLARQAARMWYISALHVPAVPELILSRALRSPARAERLLGARPAAPTVAQDARNGLGLYRANLRPGMRPRHPLRTDVPVQLIVPTHDRFVTPPVFDDLPQYCSDLTRHDIEAGHWVMRRQPDEVAAMIRAFVTAHEPPVGGGPG
jgi:pimeloyl-ACP methyl ester carboxylesterase